MFTRKQLTVGIMLATLSAIELSAYAAETSFASAGANVLSSLASDASSKIRSVTEPGDSTKGEVERIRSIYAPTGETVDLSIVYQNGTTMRFSYVAGRLQREEEFVPHPAKTGLIRKREAFLNQSGDKIWQKLYRVDGSLEQNDRYTSCCISRTKFAADGKTEVSKMLLDKATESPMLQPTQQRIYR